MFCTWLVGILLLDGKKVQSYFSYFVFKLYSFIWLTKSLFKNFSCYYELFFLVLQKREDEFSDQLNHKVSFSGFTALMYAVLMDNVTIVNLLLENEADPSVENELGLKARDYATNNPQLLNLLKEYEEKVSV